MELQPIVGTDCAHCHERILVDADGRNCKRCGLAVHRACRKAHRDECARKPALAAQAHDYDEVTPIEWTSRFVVLLAVAAFLTMFGLGLYLAPEAAPPPGQSVSVNKPRAAVASVAIAVGVVLAAGTYWFARSKPQRR